MANQYKTQSLALAAALQVSSSSKLELIDFSPNKQRATFIFDAEKDPKFENLVTRFWSRQLPVDAGSYFDAIRYLKSRLYQEK